MRSLTSAERRSPIRMRASFAAVLAVLACLGLAATAPAAQQITDFEASLSTSQAGGHPDLSYGFELANPGQPEAAREVVLNLPEGLFGNPNAVPRCSSADYALQQCQTASQIGIVTIRANYSGNPSFLLGTAPLYYVEPQTAEETARFAFIVPTLQIPVSTPVAVRTGSDYGLRFTVAGISQLMPLAAARLEVWGFPALSSHNGQRFPKGAPGSPAGCPGLDDASCTPGAQAGIAPKPLIDNPILCSGEELEVSLSARTYQDPGTVTTASDTFPPMTGCEKLNFYPVLNAQTTSAETDAPSGLDLELEARQFQGFALSPSQIRSAVVTLPEGLTINPDAADGQTACAESQANFGTELPANCPDSAKIGTAELHTPALDGPLRGSLYFGEPRPGNQYRIFLVADGFGIHAKLIGELHPDPATGRITAEFRDLPQVPFESFGFHVFASDRGLLATPIYCTSYTVESTFVPWNSTLAPQPSNPSFGLSSGPNGRPCPALIRPFNPRLVAGTSVPLAGAFSSFHLRLDRDDGDQFLRDLNFRMPPGFTGSLRGIPYCSDAAIVAASQNSGRAELAVASCPAASQIGTTNVAAGPGAKPFNAVGKMYLSGPFKGAPLSLAAVTPALAGPYDYGVEVVRVALHVDPRTAQVSAVSDTVPEIIGGVPIRMRSIQVNIDRPNFTINPTNCSPLSVDSEGIGDQGTVAAFSSFFHAVNCAALPFVPRMTVRVLGERKTTKRSRNPRLRFELRTRRGDANMRSVAVTLPKAFQIDQRHLGNLCSRAQLAAERCAGRQSIGRVFVRTPLLDAPLRGPAYAVSGFGKLPRLAFILDGQVSIMPQAESRSAENGRLRTTVPVIPDAPVGYFRLDLNGGRQGYIVNTRDLCRFPSKTKVQYWGQNGRRAAQNVEVKAPCGKSSGKPKR